MARPTTIHVRINMAKFGRRIKAKRRRGGEVFTDEWKSVSVNAENLALIKEDKLLIVKRKQAAK